MIKRIKQMFKKKSGINMLNGFLKTQKINAKYL